MNEKRFKVTSVSELPYGVRAEYVRAECVRRKHPLVLWTRLFDGGDWLYCPCGEYRGRRSVDARGIAQAGARERVPAE